MDTEDTDSGWTILNFWNFASKMKIILEWCIDDNKIYPQFFSCIAVGKGISIRKDCARSKSLKSSLSVIKQLFSCVLVKPNEEGFIYNCQLSLSVTKCICWALVWPSEYGLQMLVFFSF